ncbi:hypothetical protein V2O64_01285 [Verrucomicrobiaceae bacterium 227]
MKKSDLKIHGCWAAAFVSAFVLGSQIPARNAGAPATGGDRVSDRSTSVSGARAIGDSGSTAQSTRGGRSSSRPSQNLLTELFAGSTFSTEGMEALATEAFRDPNPVKRRLAYARLLEGMTPENATLIRDQLVSLKAGGQEWRDFNYAWGALAGQDAFEQALLTDRKDLESLMTGWAAANPEGAMAMLENLPEDLQKDRGKFESSIVSGLADRDLDAAAAYVGKLASEGHQNAGRLMDIVASETLRKDGAEAAAAWSQSLPDGPLKGAAMDRIAGTYARQDPVAAAQWVEQFASEEYAVKAVEEIGQRWARADPLTAVSWLDKLPAGEGQKAGLNSAFGDWEDRDPVAAGKYLLSMDPSPKRDSAISGFANGYAYQDPQTAIAWAQDISDVNLRTSSLTRAGQAYFRTDPESAKAWLSSSGLSPDVQKAIQTPPTRRRR